MDTAALDAARALLPGWVPWFPLVSIPAAAAIAAAVAGAGTLAGLRHVRRLPVDAHWTERARAAWPVRRAALLSAVPAVIAASALPAGGPLSWPGPRAVVWASHAVAFCVAVGAAFAVENRLVERVPLAARLRSLLAWMVLAVPGLVVAIGYVAIRAGAEPGVLESAAALAVTVAVSLGAGRLRAARLVGLARGPSERVARALERAVAAVPGRVPALFELPIVGANAFALPLANAVGVTDGALRVLDDDELAAVLAHEVAHVRERGLARAFRALPLLFPALVVAAPAVASAAGELWPVAYAAFFVALLAVLRRISRRLERRADDVAGPIGPAYARALEKLYRTRLVPATLGRGASHPNLHERLARAGVVPGWPPPAPPPSSALPLLAMLAVAAIPYAASSAGWGVVGDPPGVDARGEELLLPLALHHCAWDLSRLAHARSQEGRYADADAFYAAAEALEPREPEFPAARAAVLAFAGRCADARAALARAETLATEDPYVALIRPAVADCAEPPR